MSLQDCSRNNKVKLKHFFFFLNSYNCLKKINLNKNIKNSKNEVNKYKYKLNGYNDIKSTESSDDGDFVVDDV